MEIRTNTYSKRCSSKGIRKFLILMSTGIMFLVGYTDIFAETNNSLIIAPNKNFHSATNADKEIINPSVEITILRGRMLAEPNLLVWQTIKEKDNEGFEIERSQDGIAWNSIGFVAGNGNTVETHDYEFLDDKPLKGINYYRLKQVSSDGKYEYSRIVILERKSRLAEEILVQNH